MNNYDPHTDKLWQSFDDVMKDFEKLCKEGMCTPPNYTNAKYLVSGTYTIPFSQVRNFQECVKASGCVYVTNPDIDKINKSVHFHIGALKDGQYPDFQHRWNMYSPIEIKEMKPKPWYKKLFNLFK